MADPRVDYKENVMLSEVITGLPCCFTPTSGELSKTRKQESNGKTRKMVQLKMDVVKLSIKKKRRGRYTSKSMYIFIVLLSSCRVREKTSYLSLRGEKLRQFLLQNACCLKYVMGAVREQSRGV